MSILIQNTSISVIDLQTRLPFKYGIATLTSAPHLFIKVELNIDGRTSFGISADHLPPKWFTKVPEKSLDSEIDEMLDVVEHAVENAKGLSGESAFDLWEQILSLQIEWGEEKQYPPLLYKFGVSLVERAIIEAVCKDAGVPFSKAVRENILGIQPEKYFPQLEGVRVADAIPAQPISHAMVRQTVGLADPLIDDEIPEEERLSDGLPQSVQGLIRHYGLKHLKVKVFGDLEKDLDRLTRLAEIVRKEIPEDFAFTLDGNEQFHSYEEFREYWESLTGLTELNEFLTHLMFVEQPFHRDIALNPENLGEMKNWEERPLLIIDESDDSLQSMLDAIKLGYHGTSHKNCKGIFKSLFNASLLKQYREENPGSTYILSSEDLASVGPISTVQDICVAGTLGIHSIERNGHHYFKGLSAFPEEVQQEIMKAQPDLYHATEDGWPALTIQDGQISLESINRAPFGVGFVLETDLFEPLDEWKKKNRPDQST